MQKNSRCPSSPCPCPCPSRQRPKRRSHLANRLKIRATSWNRARPLTTLAACISVSLSFQGEKPRVERTCSCSPKTISRSGSGRPSGDINRWNASISPFTPSIVSGWQPERRLCATKSRAAEPMSCKPSEEHSTLILIVELAFRPSPFFARLLNWPLLECIDSSSLPLPLSPSLEAVEETALSEDHRKQN